MAGYPTTSSDLERREHDGTYGVKKVAVFGNDGSNMVQLATNSDGELKVNLETADIEIGAVEIKNGTDDTRAVVNSDGSLKVTPTMAKKITVVGTTVYVAQAPIGTAQATAGWQCKKIATAAGTTTITWADGNANFDNVATDLTVLTYS